MYQTSMGLNMVAAAVTVGFVCYYFLGSVFPQESIVRKPAAPFACYPPCRGGQRSACRFTLSSQCNRSGYPNVCL